MKTLYEYNIYGWYTGKIVVDDNQELTKNQTEKNPELITLVDGQDYYYMRSTDEWYARYDYISVAYYNYSDGSVIEPIASEVIIDDVTSVAPNLDGVEYITFKDGVWQENINPVYDDKKNELERVFKSRLKTKLKINLYDDIVLSVEPNIEKGRLLEEAKNFDSDRGYYYYTSEGYLIAKLVKPAADAETEVMQDFLSKSLIWEQKFKALEAIHNDILDDYFSKKADIKSYKNNNQLDLLKAFDPETLYKVEFEEV